MLSRITPVEISDVLKKALSRGLIKNEDSAAIFYALSRLDYRIEDTVKQFPSSALHTAAIKANPLGAVLKHIKDIGAGAEAASLPELILAEKAGFSPDRIVFDSPVKTLSEIEYALKAGVYINADSFRELERIEELLKKIPSESRIGIRINPQVGTGKIQMTSVAGEYSKFGIPIKNNRDKLIEKFLEYDWLRGVHLHIGSQGCDVDMLIRGVEIVLDFVTEANEKLRVKGSDRKIDVFDIGGGLPVSYSDNEHAITMGEYKDKLMERCPALFNSVFKLITEFGRYYHANSGWVISRVEYVKNDGGINTAMIHIGADLFLRKCYCPDEWHYDILVADQSGNLKNDNQEEYALAGPLCYAGDILEKKIKLPGIEEGDYLIIRDTGAYTLSMWSRYNSRQIPKVLGYFNHGDKFVILKEREKAEDLWKFWS